MKTGRIISRLFVVLCSITVLATSAAAQGIHLPPHERVILKNGMTVLLLEKKGVPIVSFSAIVKAGTTADPAGKEGVADLTSGLLRKGTKTRTAQQFAAEVDFTGGSFDAGADVDFTTISGEFLTKDLARGLDLFSDAILHPTFPKEETDKALAQQRDGIKAEKDDAGSVLNIYFSGYLYGDHSYGRPESGDEISLQNVGRDDIAKFYESYYTPENTILAIAGEFNSAELQKKVEDLFGAWQAKPSAAAKLSAAAAVKGKKLLLIDKPDSTQTYFEIGNLGTAVGDPDRFTLRVVNTIFGGRFTSRLNEALRVESGLTYGANSTFLSHKAPGSFLIASYTRNATTVKAIDLALEVLDKLHKTGVTAEELKSAKSYIKGQFPPQIETSGQLARRIAGNEFYGIDDNDVNQLEARVDAVTPEMAKAAIQKHFPNENLVFVLIGKASEIGPEVKKYAEKQDARKISEPGFWPPKEEVKK